MSKWLTLIPNRERLSTGTASVCKLVSSQQCLSRPSPRQRRPLPSQTVHDLLIIDGPARTSAATLDIAKTSSLVVQPTSASLDDLRPAVREFHALVKAGIPTARLTFALNRIGTDAEEAEARNYLNEAGYAVLAGCLVERPAYRQAQNTGHSITETRFAKLNGCADVLIQSLIDKATADG